MNVPPHPGFRDVLWDFLRVSPVQGVLNIRVFSSEEELFDREDFEEGHAWTVPRGLVPRMTWGPGRIEPQRQRVEPLDRQTALDAGQKLWMSLPAPVRDSLLQPGPLPPRLKISGDVKEVVYLPWECLPLPPGAFVARSVPVPYPIPPLAVSPPVRVLFIVTNPKDERLLRVSDELNAIRVNTVGDYSTDVAWEPTLSGVRATLDHLQPQIVHYVGHGATSSGQGYLVLHDLEQHTSWVSARDLAKILPSCVRLMCLSTPFTAENYDIRGLTLFAQAPPDVTIPTMVINRLPLDAQSEPTIRQFWTTFYSELVADRGDAASAFRTAQSAIAGFRDWPSFSLVLRDGTGWSLVIDAGTVETPEVKMAEFDALYSTSIANYLTQQTGGSSRAVRYALRDHSRQEAQRAEDALRSFGGFKWPGKEIV